VFATSSAVLPVGTSAAFSPAEPETHSADGDLTSGYGIGFMLERKGSHVFAGHSGSVAGYSAQAWIHRPSKTGVIVLRNATGGAFDISGLAFRALAELAGAASH
jgi:hypothetical protein